MSAPLSHSSASSLRLRSSSCTQPQRRRGISVIWMMIAVIGLLGFVSLAVDLGWVRVAEKQLQVAADAAALAGSIRLHEGVEIARTHATQIAFANRVAGAPVRLAANPANGSAGDVVFGTWSEGVFTPTLTSPNAIKVVARRTTTSLNGSLRSFFARIFGVSGFNIQRSAIAISSGPATIVLLHPTSQSLRASGNGGFTATGGVHVNSSHGTAISASGNARLQADWFKVRGGYSTSGNARIIGPVTTGAAPLADPLASLVVPNLASAVVRSTSKLTISGNQTRTLQPGRYKGGISISGNATVTFLSGTYIIEGGGLSISGNGNTTANNVFIYNTGTNDTTVGAGPLQISGNGHITWTPPTSGDYGSIGFVQHRNVTQVVQITGNGHMSVPGAIYAAGAELRLSGNGDTLGAGLIASSLTVTGNGHFNVSQQTFGHIRGVLVQ